MLFYFCLHLFSNFTLLTPSFTLVALSASKLSVKPGNNYHSNSCSNNHYSSTYSITYTVGTTPAPWAPDQSTVSTPSFPSQQALIRGLVKASYLPGKGPFTLQLLQAPGV